MPPFSDKAVFDPGLPQLLHHAGGVFRRHGRVQRPEIAFVLPVDEADHAGTTASAASDDGNPLPEREPADEVSDLVHGASADYICIRMISWYADTTLLRTCRPSRRRFPPSARPERWCAAPRSRRSETSARRRRRCSAGIRWNRWCLEGRFETRRARRLRRRAQRYRGMRWERCGDGVGHR